MRTYLKDSYLSKLLTPVIKVGPENRKVVVEKTIIYPGGGGQPLDRAWIEINGSRYMVNDVKENSQGYFTIQVAGILPDKIESVKQIIDWKYRYQNMRYHTLLHLISGYLYNKYRALATSSAIEPDHARLEVKFPEDKVPLNLDGELLTNNIKKLVNENLNVVSEEMERKKLGSEDLIRTYTNLIPKTVQKVRLVKIEDVDEQACGGTHVAKTGEIGDFKFVQIKNKGRLKKRMKMVID